MKAVDPIETLQAPSESPDISGVNWLAQGERDPRELAWALKGQGARFVTITAFEMPGDQGFCLEYIWDLDGRLQGFTLCVADKKVASIYDICEAADWIEREIHEEFAIDFIDRVYEPLLLREGGKPGVNLREVPQ